LPSTLPVTGNTEHTRPENRSFYPALDGIRTLAFVMVLLQHYVRMPWGWAGVDLFFVLSGFLITGILYDSVDDPHRAHNFYIRRTLRIFPLYYGVMVVMLVLAPLVHWQRTWGWLVWPAYLGNYARFIQPMDVAPLLRKVADFQPIGQIHGWLITPYLGHFWSLCVEEQFYLVWPWVVFWIRDRRKLLWICAATLPLCLGMRLAGEHYLPSWMLEGEILYRATPFRIDALLLGGWIALVLRGPHGRTLLQAGRKALPLALLAAAGWMALTPARHLLTIPYPYPSYHFTWALSAIDLQAGLLIIVALQPGTLVYRCFNLRPLRWFGRITYGAYVLHDIPHAFYTSVAWRFSSVHYRPISGAIALVSTTFLAWLSFRFFETPFLNLKERRTIRPAGGTLQPQTGTPIAERR
jgi:peptidoglycan/LPS O-acetylase OafA/YrhL